MIAASISIWPKLLSVDPVPALKSGLSSSRTTAASTASNAEPPPSKTFHPASAASLQPSKRPAIRRQRFCRDRHGR